MPIKCRITCLRVTLRELETLGIYFYDFVGWAAHHTVFSVACNSDSKILAALRTAETIARTQSRLDANKFPIFLVGWTSRKGFVAIWIPVGLSSGLSP